MFLLYFCSCRYDDKLKEARALGTKRALTVGFSLALIFFFIFLVILLDSGKHNYGNFRGRKHSRISQFCGYTRKFLSEIWGVASLGTAKASNPRKFLRENRILTNSQKFSPSKVSPNTYRSMHACTTILSSEC